MKKLFTASAVLASALALSACQSTPTKGDLPEEVQPTLEAQVQTVDVSQAHIGKIYFRPVNTGVQVFGKLKGLNPGSTYAIHIHENGSCSSKAQGAGGHFNPFGKPHGNPNSPQSHAGDLPNITADANGVASVNFTRRDISADKQGANSVYKRAIVLHAGADDYVSQPSGNSGDRAACGVIDAY